MNAATLDPEEILRAAVPIVTEAVPELRAVYVFGSAVEGRLRPDSDFDLAILAAGQLDSERLFRLAQDLSRVLRREVDLVDLRAVPVVLQARIVGCGRRTAILSGRSEADEFENQVLARYTAFVEERRPLVAEIVRRRAVHAG